MKTAVILCSGEGKKIWPYSVIRNKCMIPVSNKPIVSYGVELLEEMGFEKIVIVCAAFNEELKHYFHAHDRVTFITEDKIKGTAFSLLKAKDAVDEDDFLVLYGDTIIEKSDLQLLIDNHKNGALTALATPTKRSSDCIGVTLSDGKIRSVCGHARDGSTHFICAYALHRSFFETLAYNSCRFTQTQVGMMSPIEGYIEMSVVDAIKEHKTVFALECTQDVFDIDKPWQILEANDYYNRKWCAQLTANILGEGASIDKTADIKGFVKLGKNSKIGRNVIVNGSIIVGDNTTIENGAILCGNNVIGDNAHVLNNCYVEDGSTIGNRSYVGHCSELSGMIFENVYLFHYMEINGIVGQNVDIGAATVCGSLRFDDAVTPQRVNGRREMESPFGDSVFIGDYCRTGVNAILMPGVKVGAYSIVGAGVNLNKDLPNNTLLYQEQNLIEKKWSHEKYGW